MNNACRWPNAISGPRTPGKTWLSLCLFFLVCPVLLPAQNETSVTEVSGETYLEPYQSIEISSVQTGVIEEIYVKEGDYVKEGHPLLKLDSQVIEAQYQVAKARAEATGRVMAAQAERDQQNHRYSLISGIGNSAERKKEYAILQATEGNLVAAKEDVKINGLEALRIRAELEQRILKSSIEGHVITITRDVAESVTQVRSDPDKPDYLVRLVEIKTLKATGFLPYKAVRHIKVGDSLVVASSDVEEEWETEGIVEFVSPTIDPATGTMRIRVKINNEQFRYKAGVPAKIIVTVPVRQASNTNN